MPYWLYYGLAALLMVLHGACLVGNLFLLPGNWMIVASTILFAWLVRGPSDVGLQWPMVVTIVVLALVGELVEFLAGAAGAAKMGGSRRGMVLSMLGGMVGSIVCIPLGMPIPVVGPVLAAVVGATLGSFAGAYLGEQWKGRSHADRVAIGESAAWGRLGGTAGKLIAGILMVVLIAWDCLF